MDRQALDGLEKLDGKPFPAGPQHFRPPFNGFYTTGKWDTDVNDIALLDLIDREG